MRTVHTVDGSEIRRSPAEVGSLFHYFQGFIHPGWCRISSINSITKGFRRFRYLIWRYAGTLYLYKAVLEEIPLHIGQFIVHVDFCWCFEYSLLRGQNRHIQGVIIWHQPKTPHYLGENHGTSIKITIHLHQVWFPQIGFLEWSPDICLANETGWKPRRGTHKRLHDFPHLVKTS